MPSGFSRAVRPIADRLLRMFMERRPDADPAETALAVRLALFSGVYALALAGYGLGFLVVGRHLLGAIMAAILAVAITAGWYGGRASTIAGMRRAASVSMLAGAVGLTTIACIAGELGQIAAWYLMLVALAAVFLLEEGAALVWTAAIVALVLAIPHVCIERPPGTVYDVMDWEIPHAQAGLTIILAFFAVATRRATSVHVDTLASHDAEVRLQNQRLTALLEERAATQAELEAAHDRAREALHAAERARAVTEEARRLAEDANLAKSRFLANMSHELRTPLNAVIGYSELIAEDAEDAGYTELVPDLLRIRSAGKHLLRLINDLLDLAKIEAGRSDLHLENIQVSDIVREVADTVRPVAAARGNQLVVDSSARAGAIWSDATRVRQVLVNLMSNACKFTEHGTVELQATRVGSDIEFVVSDTGIGMSPEQLREVFEPFRQADPSTTRRYGGTGLGLVIARNYCELLGGTIRVESELGVGTRFYVRLPVEARPRALEISGGTPALAAPEVLSTSGDARAVCRVVAIDDDPAVRDIVARYLDRAGYYVMTAATGEAGMALVREQRPDVVLLDVKLPRVDGWSVLATLKSQPETREIPVVMLTMVDDPEVAFALGASAFLRKPVDRDALIDALHRVGVDSSEGLDGGT